MIIYFVYGIVGRICIFLLQKFPFAKLPGIGRWWKGGFLHDLWACSLCLGVWVYTILGALFGINLLGEYFYLPVVSEFITGGITSLLVFLIVTGYQAEYSTIKLE